MDLATNSFNIGKIRQTKNYQRKKYIKSNKKIYLGTNSNDISSELGIAVTGVIILLGLIWFFIIKPTISYIKNHALIFSIIGLIILTGLILGIVFYVKLKIKQKREKEIFERKQIELGLTKFTDRFGNERWGRYEEIQKWTKEDEEAKEKEKTINQVINEISNFKPARTYQNEYPYQLELLGYLKSKFPNADIEQQRGSSRPDIVVGDVAIEIKGPTRTEELKTIADKCMRYYQHFGELIIVLFEVQVYEPRYLEWEKGLKNTFPNVRIIRK